VAGCGGGRTLLRIGLYRAAVMDEIDDPVAITEAVELAKTLSPNDSPRFRERRTGPDLRHRRTPCAPASSG